MHLGLLQAGKWGPSLARTRSHLQSSLSNRELEPGGVVVLLPRPQQHRRELGLRKEISIRPCQPSCTPMLGSEAIFVDCYP